MIKNFGDFEFDEEQKILTSAGKSIRLSGQMVALLCLLLERPGDLITREEIRQKIWPDSHVEFEHSLDVVVSRLRATLGDSARLRYIETVPRKGYRFVQPITSRIEAPPSARFRRLRQFAKYAVVAAAAAIFALIAVRSRYDKFVPRRGPQTMASPASSP